MELHALLSSALESSSKSTEKINSLKSKLVDSENLIATLTQKVIKIYLFVYLNIMYCSYYYLFVLKKKFRILIKL